MNDNCSSIQGHNEYLAGFNLEKRTLLSDKACSHQRRDRLRVGGCGGTGLSLRCPGLSGDGSKFQAGRETHGGK